MVIQRIKLTYTASLGTTRKKPLLSPNSGHRTSTLKQLLSGRRLRPSYSQRDRLTSVKKKRTKVLPWSIVRDVRFHVKQHSSR